MKGFVKVLNIKILQNAFEKINILIRFVKKFCRKVMKNTISDLANRLCQNMSRVQRKRFGKNEHATSFQPKNLDSCKNKVAHNVTIHESI